LRRCRPTERSLSEARRMLDEAKPDLCGDSKIVDGFWLETHTLGCRNAADEHPDTWWDTHLKIAGEYSRDGISTLLGDPESGKFATLTPTSRRCRREE